eukprot:3940735-Rhodomonas_salina.1
MCQLSTGHSLADTPSPVLDTPRHWGGTSDTLVVFGLLCLSTGHRLGPLLAPYARSVPDIA